MADTIRLKVDTELTRRVGTWFTVREIQEKLRVNPATLKPLLMKYARQNLLKRRHVKGTARSVQFTPAAGNKTSFEALLVKSMPYRNFASPAPKSTIKAKTPARATTPSKGVAKRATKKASRKKH